MGVDSSSFQAGQQEKWFDVIYNTGNKSRTICCTCITTEYVLLIFASRVSHMQRLVLRPSGLELKPDAIITQVTKTEECLSDQVVGSGKQEGTQVVSW